MGHKGVTTCSGKSQNTALECMRMKVLNAFSLNMLAEFPAQPLFEEISVEEARYEARAHGLVSAVGHADTANVFSDVLGVRVPANRMTVTLRKGEVAVIGQYRGPRLPEGAKALPEGASISWYRVTVK